MARDRRPDDAGSAAVRLAAAMLTWVAFLAAVVWALLALRLTAEDVVGIAAPRFPLSLLQLVVAVLGALSVGLGTSRAGWYLRTGRGGAETASAVGGAAVLFAAWALIVLPEW